MVFRTDSAGAPRALIVVGAAQSGATATDCLVWHSRRTPNLIHRRKPDACRNWQRPAAAIDRKPRTATPGLPAQRRNAKGPRVYRPRRLVAAGLIIAGFWGAWAWIAQPVLRGSQPGRSPSSRACLGGRRSRLVDGGRGHGDQGRGSARVPAGEGIRANIAASQAGCPADHQCLGRRSRKSATKVPALAGCPPRPALSPKPADTSPSVTPTATPNPLRRRSAIRAPQPPTSHDQQDPESAAGVAAAAVGDRGWRYAYASRLGGA